MTREGFLIPNASDVAPNYQPSQPDRGDFVVLGNSQYGIITGCEVSLSDFSVQVGVGSDTYENVLVVEGKLRVLGSVPLMSIQTADPTRSRFDLVVYSLEDGLKVVTGSPSANPVYPDIDEGVTVLAAVFVPPSASAPDLRLIDKRNFIQTSLIAVDLDTDTPLVSSRLSSSNTAKFTINKLGKLTWDNGSALEADGTANLKITGSLSLPSIVANTSITVGGKNVVTEGRISWGTTEPTGLDYADKGRIFVNTSTAAVEVYSGVDNNWITLESAVPPGTVIQSFVDATTMAAQGWLLLDGTSHHKDLALNLWTAFPAWRDGDYVILPNMSGRFPIGTPSAGTPAVGTSHGSASTSGNISFTITEQQMPSHIHRSGNNTSSATHSHNETNTSDGGDHSHGSLNATQLGGEHSHGIDDKSHFHTGYAAYFIMASINGQGDSQLDGPYNDSGHRWFTHANAETAPAFTGITTTNTSNPVTHRHSIDTSDKHHHTVQIVDSGAHTHTIPEHNSKGGNQPVNITVPSMNIYFYIKK